MELNLFVDYSQRICAYVFFYEKGSYALSTTAVDHTIEQQQECIPTFTITKCR